jgi:dTDP-4-amino-4,6-dideoxygalactose transaminase
MEDGIPLVSLYYQMVDELPREGFPVSYSISDSILNLPTHQCINKNDVLTIVDALNHFVPRNV